MDFDRTLCNMQSSSLCRRAVLA